MDLGFLVAVVTLPAIRPSRLLPVTGHGPAWRASSGPCSTLVPSEPVPLCPEGLGVSLFWPP